KAGRFEEELKLMRSLNGLLALTLRWLDLIRSLRSLLSSAEAAGHAAGEAFAHHELGSLNLCAGRAQEASEHLREAFRLESQIGDLAGQCATRHNLDSARRDALARRGWGRRPRRLLRSAVIAAAFLLGGGGGTALALVIGGNDGGGDHSPATLIVRKDFVPNAPAASVTISVTCTKGGRPDKPQKAATEAAPAVFKITRFGKRATCTASEGSVPSGYAPNARDCQQVAISRGASPSCTIINTRASVSSATFTVTKDFSDDSTLKVSIGLSCDSGTVAETPVPAAEGVAATFSITGFGSGTTCTATEGT